uniref:D-aminoacyl-tRNA deacylase n=1 Tax=Staphylothermus marinus TaxID=2280 RepID=A0A7C4DAE3_STAMA
MIGLAYSVRDPAGSGIARYIVEYYKLESCSECIHAKECYCSSNFVLAGFEEDVLYFEFLDHRVPGLTQYYIVLSRHSSIEGVKSFTVHHTGNYGEAAYGGKSSTLSVANPPVTHKLLLLLKKISEEKSRLDYEICYEATHHGPTNNSKPLSFVEIGSSVEQWNDKLNHSIVGEAVIEFLENPFNNCIPTIGFGGTHYPRKHTELAFEKNYCYGHIMPRYALQYLSSEIVEQMINKTSVKPQHIVVEKKSTRKEHRELIEKEALKHNLSIEYV